MVLLVRSELLHARRLRRHPAHRHSVDDVRHPRLCRERPRAWPALACSAHGGAAVIAACAIATSLTFTGTTSVRLYNSFFRLNMYSVDSEWMAFRKLKKNRGSHGNDADGGDGQETSALLQGGQGGPGFTCQRCRHPVGPKDRFCSKCNHSLLGL